MRNVRSRIRLLLLRTPKTRLHSSGLFMKPRIFISSVTSEFGTSRQLVANVLSRLGYDPVWQDIFGTESGDLRQVLREKIDDCDGLIQLVGRGYGAEPPTVDAEFGRVSYTQFEFLYARARGKKTWLIFADEGCTRDRPLDELDLPKDEGEPESVSSRTVRELTLPGSPRAIQAERRALQEAWQQRWKRESHLFHGVASDIDLELRVERLRDEFAELRREFRWWQQSVTRNLTIVAALALVSVGVGMYVARQQQQLPDEVATKTGKQVDQAQKKTVAELQKLYENPDVLTGTLKSHIRKRAAEEIQKARQAKADWRKIDEIEKLRDQALDRVDDLVKTIREGLTGDPDPVFAEAARLLAEAGVQEAIDYLESKQPETLDQVDRLIERQKQDEEKKRELLKRLHLEANLRETNFEWDKALKLYEVVAIKAPDWFDARNRLGMVLLKLARFPASEPHLQAATKLAANPADEAAALNNLAQLFQATTRLAEAEALVRRALVIDEHSYRAEHSNVARDLNNLAQLLLDTNRLVEAEPLMRRALAIAEQSYGTEHSDVATALNNLAQLLQATNRLAEAEPLMRRALAITEQRYGAEHPNVAIRLNNLAGLLQAKNSLTDAEPLMCRALAITEQSYGTEHPDVARSLNNLAKLLQDTNRLAEAEPLMRRALTIFEKSLGPEHPTLAIGINNLAQLLRDTNRLAESEPLMRRALAIFEKFLGPEHPTVATGINNLAQLLQTTNRLAEAEPLYRRALAIDEQSYGAEHPSVAGRLNNLTLLLQVTNRLAEAEPLMRRALAIDEQSNGAEHPDFSRSLNNLALLLYNTNRLAEAEPLMRHALVIDEHSYGAEHPAVAIRLNNLARLLQTTNRLTEAEPLMRRPVTIFHLFGLKTGHQHRHMQAALAKYRALLQTMKLPPDETDQRVQSAVQASGPLKAIVPEVDRLLGPAKPVADILAALDRQYKAEDKPPIYFLRPDQPIAPHLDELLGRSKLDVPLNEPIVPHLEKLLGPAKSPQEVFETLDRQYREQNKSAIWFLPLSQPIAPHLDELLGPLPTKDKE